MRKHIFRKSVAMLTAMSMMIGNFNTFAIAEDNKVTSVDDEWTMIWNDEFDGNSLDTTKWSYQIGNGSHGWGNNEKQYYTKENVTVSDGTLKITAKEENKNGFNYTSSRIRTVTDDGQKLFTAKYGKFEARIKLPEGQGMWPAFWMMPADNVYGLWPLSGEIDIMEARGRVLNQASGTIHYGERLTGHKATSYKYTFDEGEVITDFHTYGVEWNENTIIWYIDGVEYGRTSNWYTMNEEGTLSNYPAPFDQEFYLILNLAVGGNYDNGLLPESGDCPGVMEVDYVRVYQKTSGYSEENISMPEGTRDEEMYNALPKYDGNNLLTDISTCNTAFTDRANVRVAEGTWYFLNTSKYGGAATLTPTVVDNKNFALIDITDGGTGTYSVQLEHLFELAKGYTYKVSFDAMSLSGDRTIAVKLMNSAYLSYLASYRPTVTGEMSHYELSFVMNDESDYRSRIQFNLGAAEGKLLVGNIRLEAIDNYLVKETPVVEEETTTVAPVVEEETTTVAPVVEEETTVAPVVEEETTVAPVVEEETTTVAPVVEEETTTVAPVVEEVDNKQIYYKDAFSVGIISKTFFGFNFGKSAFSKVWNEKGIALEAGKSYTISFSTNTTSASGKTVGFALIDENGKTISGTKTVKKDIIEVTYTFTPEKSGNWELAFYLYSNSGNYNLNVYDVTIVRN